MGPKRVDRVPQRSHATSRQPPIDLVRHLRRRHGLSVGLDLNRAPAVLDCLARRAGNLRSARVVAAADRVDAVVIALRLDLREPMWRGSVRRLRA